MEKLLKNKAISLDCVKKCYIMELIKSNDYRWGNKNEHCITKVSY